MRRRHEEFTSRIDATPEALFALLDDQTRLSAHMSKRSWKLGWGKMEVALDDRSGRAVGSHIILQGRVLGIRLYLDEVVTMREPPCRKRWATTGEPHLLVIGPYEMGFAITNAGARETTLHIDIEYELPVNGVVRWFGRWLAPWYAKWCVRRMANDAAAAFSA